MKRNQNRRRWEAPHNNNNNNNGNSNIRARPQVLLIVSSIIVIVYISQVVFYVFCASRLPFFQEQHDDQHIIMMTITTSNTASSRPSSSRPAAAIMKTSTRRTRSHDHQHHVVAGVGADTTTIISNKTKDATTNAAPLPLPNNTMEKGMEANNTTKNCVCDGYDLIHDLLNKLDHGDDVESDPVGGDREEDYQEQVSETTATSRKTSTITSISNKPLYDEEGNNKAAGSFPFHSSEGKEKKENNYHTRVTTGGKSYSFLAEDQMAPRVCVIVTTYNVVGYVAQAMESILNQTYKNLEVIVVDDHSNDGTVELVLEKYVKNSSRMDPTMMTSTRNSTDNINVQVISLQQNTNGGTGQPSNIGMESCSSSTDYIMFADGDDYMELDAVEALVGMAKKCKAQVVIGHHDEVTQNADGSTSINPTRAFSDWRKIPSRTPFNISTHPLSLLTSPAPWRKLYLRAFLIDHHIQFQEGDYFYEDSAFHWNVMIHATQCCKVDRRLFHYRRSRVGQTSYGLRTNASEQSKNTTQSDESYSIEMVNALTNAAKMGGVLPNAHHVSRILSDFFTQKHDQSQQSRVSSSFDKQKKKIVSIYFRLLTKSFIPSFGQKQVTSKMKAKFARRLEDINQQIWSPQEQEYISIPSDYTMALKNLKKRHLKNEHPIDLSIVVTTLNAASSIQLLLDQVYAELSQLAVQSNFHFEIFSIDRGSNDDTFSVLRKYAQGQKSNFYLMSSSSDAGEGRAFNKAIPFLEGKYVYFLNTDYSYNFTALAESVSYAAANDHDVLILPPVSSMSSKDNEGTKKMQTTTTLPNDDLIWRAVKGLENRVDPQIQKHAALGLSSSSLWRQITASKLIFDEDIAFGPTRDNYLVQFHWLSIGASKNLRFYDKAVWSSSSHNNTTTMNADDNSSVGGYDDIVSEVFASIGIAQRAMAKSGIFQAKDGDIIFQQWKCFVSSFLHTTQTTIPQASVAKFQVLYNHFNTHILSHGIPPKDLQSFPYWGATRFAEPILVQSQLRDHVYAS